MVSYGALGRLGRLAGARGRARATSPRCRGCSPARALPGDVALVQVAPPDADGRCSLGVSVDYLADALPHARAVIAEVNERCPATAGAWVAWDRLDAVVHTSRPLLEARAGRAERDRRADRGARRRARLRRRHDPAGRRRAAGGDPRPPRRPSRPRRALGDDLRRRAAADRRRRRDQRAQAGRPRRDGHGRGARQRARCSTRSTAARTSGSGPVSHTHAPAVLAGVGPLVAINSAVEIDLAGQVNSEAAGGPPDRRRRRPGRLPARGRRWAAASRSSRCPPSGSSRELSGPVSTARSDVDWVVTEHGARSLAGLTARARTDALLELSG